MATAHFARSVAILLLEALCGALPPSTGIMWVPTTWRAMGVVLCCAHVGACRFQVMVLDEFTPSTAWDWQSDYNSVSDESKDGEADSMAACRLRMYAKVLRQAKQQFQFHAALRVEPAHAAIRAATADAQVGPVPSPTAVHRGYTDLPCNELRCGRR